MSDNHPVLLVTRPKAAAGRFASDFRLRFGAGWPVVISPLMRTHWLAPALELAGFDGLVFTSETAVRAFARLSGDRELVAWCVGARTAAEATDQGFRAVAGPGDAQGLAALLSGMAPGRRLLWPRGADIAQDLAVLVGPEGPVVVPATVYAQDRLDLTPEARDCLAGPAPVLLPFFSPRSVQLFRDAAGSVAAPLYVAAISQAVASAVEPIRPARLCVSERPDSESLLVALATLSHPASGS